MTDRGELTGSLHTGVGVGEVPVKSLGDALGGVLLVAERDPLTQAEADFDRTHGGKSYALVRVGLATDSLNWRYPLGRWASAQQVAESLAQAHDGTLFGLSPTGSELFALDGVTGQLKFRQSAPKSVTHYKSTRCPQLNFDEFADARFTAPRIDGTGSAALVSITKEAQNRLVVPESGACAVLSIQGESVVTTVTLYRIGTSGSRQETQLAQDSRLGTFWHTGDAAQVLPDDSGGVLASWLLCDGLNCDLRARHVSSALGNEYSLSGGFQPYQSIPPGLSLSGPGRIGFGPNGAINLLDGTPIWSTTQLGAPAVALEGGGAVYESVGGLSTLYGPDGSVQVANLPAFVTPTGQLAPALLNGGTWFGWKVHNWQTADYRFGAVVASAAYASRYGFSLQEGDERGSRAVTTQGTGIFAKGHNALLEQAFHVGIWMVPADQRRWSTPVQGDPVCPVSGNNNASCFRIASVPSGVMIATDHKFATIDGKPFLLVFLNSVVNSDGTTSTDAADFELLYYPRSRENQLIKDLFALNSHYPQDAVPYKAAPAQGSGMFNSNSFAATLLALAGINLPVFPSVGYRIYPGWDLVIPAVFFGR